MGIVLLNAFRCLQSLNRLAQYSSADLTISTQLSFSDVVLILGVPGAPATHEPRFLRKPPPISLVGREGAELK